MAPSWFAGGLKATSCQKRQGRENAAVHPIEELEKLTQLERDLYFLSLPFPALVGGKLTVTFTTVSFDAQLQVADARLNL